MRKYPLLTLAVFTVLVHGVFAQDSTPVITPHLQQHEALFTHCTSQWSADAVSEVCCAWALEHGYPVYEQDKNCITAGRLCAEYFTLWLPKERQHAAVYCALFVEQGPSLLDDTW